MTAIYFIRHAETTLSASRVVQFPATPLNRRGRWQALTGSPHGCTVTGSRTVVSSDYVRARATVERISV